MSVFRSTGRMTIAPTTSERSFRVHLRLLTASSVITTRRNALAARKVYQSLGHLSPLIVGSLVLSKRNTQLVLICGSIASRRRRAYLKTNTYIIIGMFPNLNQYEYSLSSKIVFFSQYCVTRFLPRSLSPGFRSRPSTQLHLQMLPKLTSCDSLM